ncbi:MAG TPA: glycosyl hydrolase [Phycisphaerae bacterium]|nr:glycosyl hydrolase [Phycisphaerae bacterium]
MRNTLLAAGLTACMATILADRCVAQGPFVPRVYYGARFEPVSGVWHGAGQTYSDPMGNLAFENYGLVLGPDRYPLIFMAYNGLTSSSAYYNNLKTRLNQIQANTGRYVVVQFGWYMPTSGYPTADDGIRLQTMCGRLNSLGRPMFIRIGYEFNGTWYSPMYQPEPYKAWFRLVTDYLRANNVPAATAWCAFPGYSSYYGSWDYLDDFYPGNEYVDWWSFDSFAPATLSDPMTLAFLDKAEQHGKPVLIGETTPTGVGAEDAGDWNDWFVPFFNLIHSRKGIKAHTYINYDWSLFVGLETWGDARLETADPYVRAQYVQEMSNPTYRHAETVLPDEFMPTCNAARHDTDGDGLGDACDVCPHTAPGSPIDTRGCPPRIKCDFDGDGDVDLDDFAHMQACLTGTNKPQTFGNCQNAKMDTDTDVDGNDLTIFRGCMRGPKVPADPSCGT